jgi:hypothetical protein
MPFNCRDKTLLIDQMRLKLFMIVVGTLASVLVVWFFSIVTTSYARVDANTGAARFLINWVQILVVFIGL